MLPFLLELSMNMFEIALSFGSKLLGKIPDYDQKKKSQFFKLQDSYNKEKMNPDRDDDKLLNIKEELAAFLRAFQEEIKS